ncbi:hypothetical protein N431DRAFT_527699 [Stipitochalara longipes BDJ]|nr:hypothetical protein N431DRAFT_527699 [Stipitochalara longipes BDJ]
MPAELNVVFEPAHNEQVPHKLEYDSPLLFFLIVLDAELPSIVFVHGLNPRSSPEHSENTWTHENGTTMWPKDLLPLKIPSARICIFTYNSNVAWEVSESGIRGHANSLLDLLQGLREETALVLAKQNDRVYDGLLRSTKSLAFFATPHRGGNGTTLGQVAVNAITFFSGNLRNDLVESLKKSSRYLAQLSADFAHQYENYDFLSVVETRGLMRAPVRTVVVNPASAVIGLAGHREQVLELDRDHRQICKFIQDADYNRVARHLKRLADAASRGEMPNVETSGIQGNTASAHDVNPKQETPPPATAKLFSTLDFVHRPALIGQSNALQWLDNFVTSAHEQYLLIRGPPGSGKSAIAAEFATRQDGKMSVFWLCAESQETVERGFKLISHKISQGPQSTEFRYQQEFKNWLEKEHRGKWLIVFDNAPEHLDIRGLLPTKGGKVIITSRHSSFKTDAPFITNLAPSLDSDGATGLFLAKWQHYHYTERFQLDLFPSTAAVIQRLHDRPLAIILAASCVSPMRFSVAQEHIQILDGEQVSDAGLLDPKIWRWFYHLLDALTPAESDLLSLFSIFDSTYITDDFLDFITSCHLGEETILSSRHLPESTTAEDDGAQDIDIPTIPPWISRDQEVKPALQTPLQRLVLDSIRDFFLKDVKQCLLMAAISRPWHGVREDIFQYTRELPNAPRESPIMRQIIDSIDKGGCAGLQSAAARSCRDEGFNKELRDLGRRSLNHIAELVTFCLSEVYGNDSSEITPEILQSAVTTSMEWYQFSSFFMIGGAFHDLFEGTIKATVCSVIEPSITSGSNVEPESFERVVAFMVDTVTEKNFQQRSKRVARGYWEVVGAMGVFFAADLLMQLSVASAKDAITAAEKFRTDDLISKAIELAREGIMALEQKQTPAWKLSVRRAASWCLQAEQCRNGWGSSDIGYDYPNEEHWEDSCILLGMNESSWALSSLI